MSEGDVLDRRLRRFLLLLAMLAQLSTLIELWLENHMQGLLQLVPWVLCSIGLMALVLALARPGRATLLGLRVVMSLVALGGIIGIGVHLKQNYEFQQEIHPASAAADFILPALKGAAPLLAPGALTFAALLALAATYHHPAWLSSTEQELSS